MLDERYQKLWRLLERFLIWLKAQSDQVSTYQTLWARYNGYQQAEETLDRKVYSNYLRDYGNERDKTACMRFGWATLFFYCRTAATSRVTHCYLWDQQSQLIEAYEASGGTAFLHFFVDVKRQRSNQNVFQLLIQPNASCVDYLQGLYDRLVMHGDSAPSRELVSSTDEELFSLFRTRIKSYFDALWVKPDAMAAFMGFAQVLDAPMPVAPGSMSSALDQAVHQFPKSYRDLAAENKEMKPFSAKDLQLFIQHAETSLYRSTNNIAIYFTLTERFRLPQWYAHQLYTRLIRPEATSASMHPAECNRVIAADPEWQDALSKISQLRKLLMSGYHVNQSKYQVLQSIQADPNRKEDSEDINATGKKADLARIALGQVVHFTEDPGFAYYFFFTLLSNLNGPYQMDTLIKEAQRMCISLQRYTVEFMITSTLSMVYACQSADESAVRAKEEKLRADEAQRQMEEAKRRADEAKREREEAQGERIAAEHRADEAKRERIEAERERIEAEHSADEAERRLAEALRLLAEAQARAQRAEAENVDSRAQSERRDEPPEEEVKSDLSQVAPSLSL